MTMTFSPVAIGAAAEHLDAATVQRSQPAVAQVIIAETGADMSRFQTAAHLAA
jgi:hypothetical protein